MKEKISIIILLFCFNSYSQDLFEGVEYKKYKTRNVYSEYFDNIIFKKKKPLIINFIAKGELNSITRSIIFDTKILKIETNFEFIVSKDMPLKFIVVDKYKEEKFYALLDTIIAKGYLQKLKQVDLDIDYSKEGVKKILEQGDAYYSDRGSSFIEFYQGEKYYKLQVDCSNNRMGRNQEKLDLFNELYKLLNDTWNIQNGVQGRFIENKEN